MKTTRTILRNAAMQGDFAAMGAYADYLEEINGDKALLVGLRFCVKYRKFPRYHSRYRNSNIIDYWWNCNKVNKIGRIRHMLPLFMEHLTYSDFRTPTAAITAVGRSILQINDVFQEIV